MPQQTAIADSVERLVARVIVLAAHLPDVLEVETQTVAVSASAAGCTALTTL